MCRVLVLVGLPSVDTKQTKCLGNSSCVSLTSYHEVFSKNALEMAISRCTIAVAMLVIIGIASATLQDNDNKFRVPSDHYDEL